MAMKVICSNDWFGANEKDFAKLCYLCVPRMAKLSKKWVCINGCSGANLNGISVVI